MFASWARVNEPTSVVHVSEFHFFFSKFVECDWNSKISQNVQNLGFLKKIDGFFEKKIEFRIKVIIDKGGKFAVECVSNGIIS